MSLFRREDNPHSPGTHHSAQYDSALADNARLKDENDRLKRTIKDHDNRIDKLEEMASEAPDNGEIEAKLNAGLELMSAGFRSVSCGCDKPAKPGYRCFHCPHRFTTDGAANNAHRMTHHAG